VLGDDFCVLRDHHVLDMNRDVADDGVMRDRMMGRGEDDSAFEALERQSKAELAA
jgi:hypothetical protein